MMSIYKLFIFLSFFIDSNLVFGQISDCNSNPDCVKKTLIEKPGGWYFEGSTYVNFGSADCMPVENQIIEFSTDSIFIRTKVLDCNKKILFNEIIYRSAYELIKSDSKNPILRIYNFSPNIENFIMRGLPKSEIKPSIDFQLLLNTASTQFPKLILRNINNLKQAINYENRFE